MIRKIICLIIGIIIILKKILKKKMIKLKGYKYINEELELQIIKNNNTSILVIDNFLKSPKSYLKLLNKSFFKYDYTTDFPGYRKKPNKNLTEEIGKFISEQLKNKYYFFEGNKINTSCAYSIITGKNNNLTTGNMNPHRDCNYFKTYKYSGIASVIYLCNPSEKYGGTAIYNQLIPTGQPRFLTDSKYLEDRKKFLELEKIYCADKDEHFYKKINQADIKFNRAIFYPTHYFHQPIINHKFFDNGMDIEDEDLRFTITSWQLYDKKIKLNDINDNIFKDANDEEDPLNENFNIDLFYKRRNVKYDN